jgi:two-component system, NtrC family, sensor histidine kinase GlrK
VGFAVVLTPLIAAVAVAIIQVDRLAQDSRLAVLGALTATGQSRALVQQLTEMQRALGQFEVRGDRDFYDIYLQRREVFRNALENLIELNLSELGAEELLGLKKDEQALFDDLGGQNGQLQAGMTWEDGTKVLENLGTRARAVLAESNRLIETRANDATESAAAVQRTLLLLTGTAIPVTLLLAGVFVTLLTRPMRALGGAIGRLGARELSDPIEIRGPRDVEALGKQLDWLRRRIKDLEDQKSSFLRHISHELKTPLTTLREGSQLLVESLADGAPEEAEISRLMCSNSLRLEKLIEDLLQFAKTQELTTDLKVVKNVDMAGLVSAAIASQSVASASKEIVVAEHLSPVRICGDANKLRIIVDNLLSNAIKYTPVGGRIAVSLGVDDGRAVFDVEDTGPGVGDSEAEKIFEPFQQGRAVYQSSVKGSGLGLAIAREYVEAHDGYIEVIASRAGAHFRVVLPLEGPASVTTG